MINFKNIKPILLRIFAFGTLIIFTGTICFSQLPAILADSSKLSQKKTETAQTAQDKIQNQNKTQNQGSTQKSANAVKQVRSAKPDMSKAKGARPNIVRPSGSAVPKGAGKPGGVKRMGGR